MTTTFIDTNRVERTKLPGQGEVAEVLNTALCGAKNVLGMLRWLNSGDRFEAEVQPKFQLLYVVEGKGTVSLGGEEYAVGKGAGVFLGVLESASIRATDAAPLKLLHLIVPQIPKG